MPAPPSRGVRRRRRRGRWLWLPLLVLVLLPLATFAYNRSEPRLLGFPFFYWGQLGLILVVTLGTLGVHLRMKKGR